MALNYKTFNGRNLYITSPLSPTITLIISVSEPQMNQFITQKDKLQP